MTRKFEAGQLYVKYVKDYKVIYRITKRTYKKIYFMSIAVETKEPISKFDATLSCTSGLVADISDLFNEYSANISDLLLWDLDAESFTIWNNSLGPLYISCLDIYKEGGDK